MPSATDICQLGLTRARAGSINDLNEQSAEAAECRVLYPNAIEYVLSRHQWRFAKRVVPLNKTTVSPQEYAYEYDVPNDCVEARYVLPAGTGAAILANQPGYIYFNPLPWELAAGDNDQSTVILCSHDDAYLCYTRRVTGTALFSQLFIESVAWHMASDLAIKFGGDKGDKYVDRAINQREASLSMAMAKDANQAQRGNNRLSRNLAVRSKSTGPTHYYYNGQIFRVA